MVLRSFQGSGLKPLSSYCGAMFVFELTIVARLKPPPDARFFEVARNGRPRQYELKCR